MVGNGVTDRKFDGNALVPFAHGMGLISDNIYEEVEAACEGNYFYYQSGICSDKLDRVDQVKLYILTLNFSLLNLPWYSKVYTK